MQGQPQPPIGETRVTQGPGCAQEREGRGSGGGGALVWLEPAVSASAAGKPRRRAQSAAWPGALAPRGMAGRQAAPLALGKKWQEEGGLAGGTEEREPVEDSSLLSHLVGSFQHLHQEGVDRRVAYELEEEEVLQALQANGAKGREAKQELGKPRKEHGG